jgi:pantothenate kinase
LSLKSNALRDTAIICVYHFSHFSPQLDTGELILEELTKRVIAGLASIPADNRFIVGIVGFPGAGKSTLSGGLVDAINAALPSGQKAQIVPMDGYHLPNETLDTLGLRPLKGIPETFDAEGFIQLLRRIRETPAQALSAPAFDRSIDGSIADAIKIGTDVRVIVTEGNYLLLDREKWRQIAGLLDDCWFLDASFETIRPRLIARHVEGGRSLEDAIAKVESTDLPNARLIEETRRRAGAIVRATGNSGVAGGFQYEITTQ